MHDKAELSNRKSLSGKPWLLCLIIMFSPFMLTGCPGTVEAIAAYAASQDDGDDDSSVCDTTGDPTVSYTLTYVASANGSIAGSTPQSVNKGACGSAVAAVPVTGYSFVKWSDGSTANPRIDTNVTADISVTASFAINSYSLSYTAGSNGSITGTTPQTVNHGANGTQVTAVPATGYSFVSWSDGSTANPRTDSNVTANISVTANFVLNSYTLTYIPGANGSITGTTPQTVNHGSNGSAVTAVPATGYSFVSWSDGSTVNPRTDSNVTGDISVTANFVINSYTLTYAAGANGSITGTSPQTVNHGSDGSAVTAVANAGYAFASWSDTSTVNPRTDSNVTADVSVTASFALNLAAPANVRAAASKGRITVFWDPVPNAGGYDLCYSTTSISDFANCSPGGTLVTGAGVSSPHTVMGLTNGIRYYVRVAATLNGETGPASAEVNALPTGLNDTGITKCGDYAFSTGNDHNNNLDCSAVGATATADGSDSSGTAPNDPVPAGQDAHFGRDAEAQAGTLSKIGGGVAGFDFSKVCNSGEVAGEGSCPADPALGATANEWACTRDNVTGLIWEVKTDDNGLRDKDHGYRWYKFEDPDVTNGGSDGAVGDTTTCSNTLGGKNCNTQEYVTTINALTGTDRLCGATDWRLPAAGELLSIAHRGVVSPAIDSQWFPNTVGTFYWSSSPDANVADDAWFVYFFDGSVFANRKFNSYRVRLVRAGQ